MTDRPAHIGPYQVTREIGRGGMGVVYLARDERLDRDGAIKCLPEELGRAPNRLARFEREGTDRSMVRRDTLSIGRVSLARSFFQTSRFTPRR